VVSEVAARREQAVAESLMGEVEVVL